MAAAAMLPEWAFQPKPSDPDAVKAVNTQILDELVEKVGALNSMRIPFVKALWFSHRNGHLTESVGDNLTVDFERGVIEFPAVAITDFQPLPPLSVDLVRCVSFLNVGERELVSDGQLAVVLSMWEKSDKNISSIYLVLNLLEALLLANAVSRLVATRSLERTKVLSPLLSGKVKVSTCDSSRHSERGGCCDPDKVMTFTVDCESLGFYENRFSNRRQFDFRFYKEQGERSIDVIMINKTFGHILMRQASNIYIIKKCADDDDGQSFDRLVQMFRDDVIKSQPERYFVSPDKPLAPAASSSQSSSQWIPSLHSGSSRSSNDEYRSSRSSFEYRRSYEDVWQDAEHLDPEWLTDLRAGRHVPTDEEMLLEWCPIEFDLKDCLNSGTVPYTSPESGGLNPKSQNHLQQSLEDIKDQLLQDKLPVALSRLRACRDVFGDTLLKRVKGLDEVEFMKRIYFLSGRD